jgi:hypothetical protein
VEQVGRTPAVIYGAKSTEDKRGSIEDSSVQVVAYLDESFLARLPARPEGGVADFYATDDAEVKPPIRPLVAASQQSANSQESWHPNSGELPLSRVCRSAPREAHTLRPKLPQ